MLDIDDFSRAICGVYDASMDIERWPYALSLLIKMFGGLSAQISVGSSLSEIAFVKILGIDERILAQTMPRYLELSPTDPRARLMIPFKAMHCRQVVTDEVLHASEMYRDVLRVGGIEYTMILTLPGEDMTLVLGVTRGPDKKPFTESDCDDFGRLAPHVTRAATMHGVFQRCRKDLAMVTTLLDTVPLGMMVMDNDELKVANRAARTLLSEGDTVQLQNGRLRGVTRRADADLRAAVHEALGENDQPIGVVLPIDHPEPVRALVRRLHPASAGMLGAPSEAVALYVTDPRKPIETPEEVLQRLFGLTPREASVLRILVEGEDVQDAAARLAIGIETVRSHVKHIMDATGASRQAELVGMVLSSPAWIAGGKSLAAGAD